MTNYEALETLQVGMKMRQGEWADDIKVIVGDFSYAWNPRIKSWGEDAKLYIGKFCSIAGNVQFFLGGDHRPDWATTYPFAELMPRNYPDIKGSPRSKGDIVIGNDVWIANDVKIMSGVHIGDGAVIAGSAVVTKDVLPYEMVGGVPAKHIKWRLPIGRCAQIQELAWWDWPLEKIAEAVPLLESDRFDELVEFDREWEAKHE